MSYLIALYVLYHGNNLKVFGYEPGMREEKPLNQGLMYATEKELREVLPDDVAKSIVEDREIAKMLDYESILREAIEKSQAETSKLMNADIGFTSDQSNGSAYTSYEDEFGDYDMSFFDEMNGLGRNGNNGFPW